VYNVIPHLKFLKLCFLEDNYLPSVDTIAGTLKKPHCCCFYFSDNNTEIHNFIHALHFLGRGKPLPYYLLLLSQYVKDLSQWLDGIPRVSFDGPAGRTPLKLPC